MPRILKSLGENVTLKGRTRKLENSDSQVDKGIFLGYS